MSTWMPRWVLIALVRQLKLTVVKQDFEAYSCNVTLLLFHSGRYGGWRVLVFAGNGVPVVGPVTRRCIDWAILALRVRFPCEYHRLG
jgi:hypothetical protein